MGFSGNTYSKALEIKRKQLQNSDEKRRVLKEELYNDIPRVKEIDQRLSKIGMEIVLSTFSGDKSKLKDLENECLSLNKERDSIIPKSKYEIPYFCDKCKDSGYFDGKYCSCVEQLAKEIRFEELKEIAPFDVCRFDNFDLKYYPDVATGKFSPKERMESNLKYFKKFINNFPSGENLLLIGGAGLGKTHISIAIANEIIKKGYDVFYSSIEDIISTLEAERYGRIKTNFDLKEAIQQCDLLVIDDLGTEFLTQFGKTEIYDIINSRILKNKQTIINTNLFMEEIAERYSPRISSRLIGNYTTLIFEGKDIRQLKLAEK